MSISPVCAWSQDDEDSDAWSTGCFHVFRIDDGTPEDNKMRYCCFCGRPLEQHTWEDQDN